MKLIIAEKPSVAQTIAKVVGANTRKDGYVEGNGYLVSWCVGHLIGLAEANAYDERYKKWSIADLPIIPTSWEYYASESTLKQLHTLKKLMNQNDVSEVVNACDAGREGELIFRLVYDYNDCSKPIKRLWISSLEEDSIKKGLDDLRPGADYENLYHSALCRSQADWLIGINATRLFSVNYGTTLNIGRVMTPTLALITSREDTIKNFVKEELYKIELQTETFKASYKFENDEDKKNKSLVEMVVADCENGKVVVADVNKETKKQAPPKLFDLTSLQREANKVLGLSAQETLDAAQSLYEKKLITYPRTDSQFLSEDMTEQVTRLLNNLDTDNKIDNVINNKRVTDHHAIIPTAAGLDEWRTSGDKTNLLNLIVNRLNIATSSEHVYGQTTITLNCNERIFTATGKVIIDDGYKALLKNDDKTKDDVVLPELNVGDLFEVEDVTLTPYFSKPPSSHNEASLLKAMETAGKSDFDKDVERKGLGTPATRAGIIEKLIAVGYIERKKKALLPTDKGNNIIKISPEKLTSTTLTSDWENRLKEVEQGVISADSFISEIAEFTRAIVVENQTATTEILALFPQAEKEVIGVCPRCGGNVLETPKAFSCEHTRAKKCEFALWKDNKYFTLKKKSLTKSVAKSLLKDGRVAMKGLHSEKTGKTYDAVIKIVPATSGYVSFEMEFLSKKNKGTK